MADKINKIIFDIDGKEYELDGGGGGGGVVPPDSVGSEQIIDNSVEMEDLSDNVKNKIQRTYDEDDETLHMDFDEANVNGSQQDVGQGGGEDEDLDGGSGEFNDPIEIEKGD